MSTFFQIAKLFQRLWVANAGRKYFRFLAFKSAFIMSLQSHPDWVADMFVNNASELAAIATIASPAAAMIENPDGGQIFNVLDWR